MKPKPISINTAKSISTLGYDEVIIVGANYETGVQHVTTYGKTQAACENAAVGGNAIKKLLGWPEDKCNDKPPRQVRRENLERKIRERDGILKKMINVVENPNVMDDGINLAHLVGLSMIAKNLFDKENNSKK